MADILVIQAARFGDLVQTKRLVLSLQRQGTVHLGVDESLGGLAALIYPDAVVHELALHGRPCTAGLERNHSVFRQWKTIDFAQIYNCNFSRLTAAICSLFDPAKVTGYRPAHGFDGGIERSPWSRLAFRMSDKRAISTLNLADFWAWFCNDPVPPHMVNPQARGGGKGIGIVLAGREARRSLPPPLLSDIAQKLFRLMGNPPIRLLGSRAEVPAARNVMRFFSPAMLANTENLSGSTDWQGLCEALSGLDILLTPDTGIMHLAAHLGVPVMAFFLSSAFCHETGPYGSGHMVWQAIESCSPCLELEPCPNGVACLARFRDPSFGRALALARHPDSDPDIRLQPGLQLWRSDLDELGAVLRLRAGEDCLAQKRAEVRSCLSHYLGFGACAPDTASAAYSEDILEKISPDNEWMLPPWRYC